MEIFQVVLLFLFHVSYSFIQVPLWNHGFISKRKIPCSRTIIDSSMKATSLNLTGIEITSNSGSISSVSDDDAVIAPNSTSSTTGNFYSNLFGFSSAFTHDSALLQPLQQYLAYSNRTIASMTSSSANLFKKLPKDSPLVQFIVTNDSVALYQSASEINTVKQDLTSLKAKVDKIEKILTQPSFSSAASLVPTPTVNYNRMNPMFSPSSSLLTTKTNHFVGAISALTTPTLQLNAKTIETSGIIVFFTIGSIIGASLFDRLWLIGGIFTAYWSTTVISQNNNQGFFVRRLAVKFAQLINDVMEKYNQFVIFYRTGQLAYVSSKVWKEYDDRFDFTKKINFYKKLTMERAVLQYNQLLRSNSTNLLVNEWNKLFPSSYQVTVSYNNFMNTMSDVYKAVRTAPSSAKKLDQKYQLSTSVSSISKDILQNTKNTLNEIFSGGGDHSKTSSSIKRRADGGAGSNWWSGFGSQNRNSRKANNNAFFSLFQLPTAQNKAVKRSSHSAYAKKSSSSFAVQLDEFSALGPKYWKTFKVSLTNAFNIIFDDSSNQQRNSVGSNSFFSFFPSTDSRSSKNRAEDGKFYHSKLFKKIVASLYLVAVFEITRQIVLLRLARPLLAKLFS